MPDHQSSDQVYRGDSTPAPYPVDLRPMSLGELLDRTFSLYKNHFWLFAGIMALPFLVLLLVNIGLTSLRASAADGMAPGLLGGAILGGLIAAALGFALMGAAQAATIFAVSDLYLGRTPTVRESYRRVKGRVARVLSVLFLMTLLVILGFIAFVIPGIILLCRTSVSVPAAMLENTSAGDSVRRSMKLTKGHAMQAFLIFVLVWVVAIAAAVIFQVPFSLLAGPITRPHALPFGLQVAQQLSSFLSQVLIGPIGTIAFSLLYYNLRVRKEAFDIEHLMASLPADPSSGTVPVA